MHYNYMYKIMFTFFFDLNSQAALQQTSQLLMLESTQIAFMDVAANEFLRCFIDMAFYHFFHQTKIVLYKKQANCNFTQTLDINGTPMPHYLNLFYSFKKTVLIYYEHKTQRHMWPNARLCNESSYNLCSVTNSYVSTVAQYVIRCNMQYAPMYVQRLWNQFKILLLCTLVNLAGFPKI